MPDQAQLPEGGFPEECKALMKQLHHAALLGNFSRCMELQQLTNHSLKKNGLPAPEYPVEYFQLLHQMFDPAASQDQVKMEELGARIMAIQQDAGVEFPTAEQPPLEIEFPEEFHLLQMQAAAAFKREDWPEFNLLVKEAEAIQESMGIFNLGNFIVKDPEGKID